MILIKYNEIMSSATVDPAMKSRIMGAVSKAIREQAENAASVDNINDNSNDSDARGAAVVTDLKDKSEVTGSKPYRKKAKKSPLAAIISIAAVLAVVSGAVYFVYSYMGGSMKTTQMKDVQAVNGGYAEYIDSAEAGNDSYEGAEEVSEDKYVGATRLPLTDGSTKPAGGASIKNESNTEEGESNHTTGVIGNERLDRISKKLPFELKGTGTVAETNGVSGEIFMGANGEKVVIRSAPAGTDVLAATYSGGDRFVGVDGTTPRGTSVRLYHVAFGTVSAIGKGETPSDYNAAVFTKNGNTYLITFSSITDADTIYGVIDVL